jgi:hypothetical protein
MTPMQQIIARLEHTESKKDFETTKHLLEWARDLRHKEIEMTRQYFTAGFMYSRKGWNGEEPFLGKDNETIFQNIMDGYFDFAAQNG